MLRKTQKTINESSYTDIISSAYGNVNPSIKSTQIFLTIVNSYVCVHGFIYIPTSFIYSSHNGWYLKAKCDGGYQYFFKVGRFTTVSELYEIDFSKTISGTYTIIENGIPQMELDGIINLYMILSATTNQGTPNTFTMYMDKYLNLYIGGALNSNNSRTLIYTKPWINHFTVPGTHPLYLKKNLNLLSVKHLLNNFNYKEVA